MLEVPDLQYKHLVASDLMGIFTKIWANVWSSRMEYILNNCVLALLDTPGTTLLGIPRILVDKDYRRKIIDNVRDPVVRSFWIQEYENYNDRFRGEAIAPIQNKVGQFLSTSFVRNIVGQSKSSFSVYDVMNQGKILLVNVSKGRIGEDNAALLGAMLITKIQLAAMERVRIPEEERKDFYLYVDEFQNFATDSFATILSEARKYRLNLTLAHQYIGQLVTDTTTAVRDAVFGNCGTLIVFRVGATDAEFLENEFTPELEIQDLVNLPNRNIYVKLMVDGITSRPFSATTLPAHGPSGVENMTERITLLSRKKYGRTRKDVEAEIERWSGSLGEDFAGAPTSDKPSARMEGKEERYTATCSICGNTAYLNFKPDESRPVYCSSCLKKVQSGELAAVKVNIKPRFEESLGALGIEFTQEKASKLPKQPERKPVPSIKASAPIVRNMSDKHISLKDLSKSTHGQPPRRGPDIAGLKGALQHALGGRQNHSALKPGESIKLNK